MSIKKLFKRSLWFILILFLLMNIIAFMHAYKFTHFSTRDINRTEQSQKMSVIEKLKIAVSGINNPRPVNKSIPDSVYQDIKIKGISSWYIPVSNAKGSVIIFHGYGGEKSSMTDKASVFHQLGYNTMLVDFKGSGSSEGKTTTIGYKEAEDVIATVNYLHSKGEQNIILFGTSMGAAALMKALNDKQLPVKKIIIECPFGSLLQTVKNRFEYMGVPQFPLAHLLVFWGGVQNGFNAFGHKPEEYAKAITLPALMFWGAKDPKVKPEETNNIYNNLKGPKKLVTLADAGHENYLLKYKELWTQEVTRFLAQ